MLFWEGGDPEAFPTAQGLEKGTEEVQEPGVDPGTRWDAWIYAEPRRGPTAPSQAEVRLNIGSPNSPVPDRAGIKTPEWMDLPCISHRSLY